MKVLDRNSDGKVTIQDIEQLVLKFMVGDDYGKYAWKGNFAPT